MESLGIALPLEPQAQATPETRLEAGIEAQVAILGEFARNFYRSGPEERRHINLWLVDNCSGDYYTRNGLDLSERELLTFCFIAAQGGCEPQLAAHAAANLKMGHDKAYMIAVISQFIPYIGYPRSLNALTAIENAAEKMQDSN